MIDNEDYKMYDYENEIKNESSAKRKLFEAIDNNDIFLLNKIIIEDKNPFWEYYDESGSNAIIKSSFLNITEISLILIEEAKRRLTGNEQNDRYNELKKWINHKGDNGFNALHYASFRGNIKILEKLIESGADITIRNNNGLNVMHMAAQGDQPSTLVFFKERFDMKINSLDSVLSTPLHWASYMGSESCVDYLISWKVDINARDKDGFTPLHLAVMTGK